MFGVHRILEVTLAAALLLPACATAPPPPPPPPGPQSGAVDPQPEALLPRGFVGDPETAIFHRLGCPRAEDIDPRVQEYFVTPYDAVNGRLAPCELCRPMAGWR